MKNPLIKIVENCLKVWILTRCKRVGSIKVDIKELNYRIFNSRISNINVISKDVDFNKLPIKYLDLKCQSIEIKLDLSKRKIVIKDNFTIEGNIHLHGSSLIHALNNSKWNWLSKKIALELLEKDYISSIKINKNILELEGQSSGQDEIAINSFKISANSGKINLEATDSSNNYQIPMEDSIYIEQSQILDGLIMLKGHAEVKENY
tara:strand:+ start:7446 stop:8063 length:618 start_codon:yes stop_codon:yes gene_type:complete